MSAHRRRGGEHKTATYTITHNNQSAPPVWGKPETQSDPELQNRQIAPEDMSRDRTNEFLSICRSMGTNAMQVGSFEISLHKIGLEP